MAFAVACEGKTDFKIFAISSYATSICHVSLRPVVTSHKLSPPVAFICMNQNS